MLTQLSTRNAIWKTIGVTIALLAIVAMFVFLKTQNGDLSDKSAVAFESMVADHPESVSSFSSVQPALDAALIEGQTGLDPRVVCQDPLGELSDECLDALDAYFLDKSFVWQDFDWIPLPLTYQRIFVDPSGDRERVLAALKRPECRLEEGTIRWDLMESCHAESFANYANIVYFCQNPTNEINVSSNESPSTQSKRTWEVRNATFAKYQDWGREYERRSRWVGEALLEKRWLAERACTRLDERLLWHNDHKSGYTEVLEAIGQRLELFSESWGSSALEAMFHQLGDDGKRPFGQEDASAVLRAVAARLGDEWAASIYESTAEDEAWMAQEAAMMPWKEYVKIMRARVNWARRDLEGENRPNSLDVGEYIRLFPKIEALGENFVKEDSQVRTSLVSFALGAWGELEAAGMEIDLDRLVDFVCGPHWKEAMEKCQEVISHLNEMEPSIDQSFWHRLSQFEARAIALDLYDVEQRYRGPDWEREELGIAEPMDFDE